MQGLDSAGGDPHQQAHLTNLQHHRPFPGSERNAADNSHDPFSRAWQFAVATDQPAESDDQGQDQQQSRHCLQQGAGSQRRDRNLLPDSLLSGRGGS